MPLRRFALLCLVLAGCSDAWGFGTPFYRRLAAAGGAGISILQAQAVVNTGSPAGTIAWFTPTLPLTLGSCLVVGAWNDDAADTDSGVTDVTNGAWGLHSSVDGSAAGVGWLYWFGKANNTSTGQPQVSINTTLAYGKHSGVFIEIGGCNTSTPFGSPATYHTSVYGDPIFTGSITTSSTDAILGFAVNGGKNSGLGSAGPNAGYTLVNFNGDMDFTGLLYRVAAAGTYNPGYVGTLNTFYGTTLNVKP